MKIDYISDLHLDFHVKHDGNQLKWIKKTNDFLNSLLPEEKGEVLIIAGDLSHYNLQSKWLLEFFSDEYEKVFFTIGNHDLYLISDNQRKKYGGSKFKVYELLEMISHLPNVHLLLDYNVVNYKGIKFSGSTNWYSLDTFEELNFFNSVMNDSKLIHRIDIKQANYLEGREYEELENVDVIVTHVPPIIIDSHHKFRSTYCYLNQLTELKAKHYIFGHCHEQNEYEKAEVKFYINALGYPNENKGTKIKSFEIK